MKKLYVTHRPEELAMALIQANCVGAAIWMFIFFDSVMAKIVVAQLGALSACMTYVFLFTMRGSRERAEAAQPKEQAHG